MQSVIMANFQTTDNGNSPASFQDLKSEDRAKQHTYISGYTKILIDFWKLSSLLYIYIHFIMYIIWFLTGVIAYPNTFRKAFYFSL
jgi:hypothetical protein